MQQSDSRQKIHLTWSCLYLTFLALLTLFGFLQYGGVQMKHAELVLTALIVSAGLSALIVPLMLGSEGEGPVLIAAGRILLWLQVAVLITAVVTMIVGF